MFLAWGTLYFNPRAPCGARQFMWPPPAASNRFQSTRPLRGATRRVHNYLAVWLFQSTRPLRGATWGTSRWTAQSWLFQSTRPLRGATKVMETAWAWEQISIHAPLAGRDQYHMSDDDQLRHFNPRAPCGARQQKCTNCFAYFCDNRQVLSKFAQNATCQGILIPFPFRKSLQIWVRTARAISARLRFAL